VQQPRHPLLRRLLWHPLLVVLLFADLAYRTYLGRTGILGLAGLGVIGLWLGLSVYDWLTAHRFLDLLYSEEGENGAQTSKSEREYLRRAGQSTLERDFDGAIALLDEAIRRDPQFAEAYCDRGWNYLETGMHDEALADFNKAIELKPTYALAYNNRGTLYSKRQHWDGSIADFSKTLELDPDHPWARDNLTISYVSRAEAFGCKGDFDRAMADYDRAVETDPESSSPYYRRGIFCFDQHRYDQAIADFAKAIAIEKTWPLLFERGRAYWASGRFLEAIADLTASLDLRPDDQDLLKVNRFYLAQAYRVEKGHDRAVANLTDVIVMDDATIAAPYILRGASYVELGGYDQAIADFTQAIRIQATPEAYRGRATAYRNKGQFAEALGDLGELIALRPEQPTAYQLRAETYRALGDERSASLDDTKSQVALCLGQALERLQNSDWDQAISLATEVIRLDPGQPKGYVRRGVAYLGKNEPDRALADFNAAFEELPSLPSTTRALVEEKRAQARRALGNVQPTAGAEAPGCVPHPRAAVNSRMRAEALQTETAGDANKPSAQRVTARAMVLSAIVCRALLEQEHADGIHEHADGRTALLSWIEALGLRSELEPAEFDFLATPIGRASRRQTIDGEWRKEGLSVLAWALGRFQLSPYDQPTDPDAVLQSLEFLSINDAQALRESATLRPSEEIRRFASHITIVHWRIRTFQMDPELVAPSVDFDVRGDAPVPTDKGAVLRKVAGPGIRERMDFAGYLRQHPRFENYWLDHLRLIDGDLVIGGRAIAEALPPIVDQCRSVAVERQIAAYWLAGDDVTYSKIVASTLLSGCCEVGHVWRGDRFGAFGRVTVTLIWLDLSSALAVIPSELFSVRSGSTRFVYPDAYTLRFQGDLLRFSLLLFGSVSPLHPGGLDEHAAAQWVRPSIN
jgi:tetratricopeptide (TPR) repeat protein